jgi:hypothetical protein
MRMKALAMGIVALCAAVGCAQAPAQEADVEKPELTAQDKALVLDEAPTDIPHPLYIDFNGKAELVGYALEPATMAAPGSKLSLKLFWRSTGKLDAGYLPFTELVTPEGKRIAVDGGGPVRKGALVPANWEPSKVYVDELEVSVPADIDVARFSIVVGFKTEPSAPEEPVADDDAKKADKKPEKAAEGTFGAVYLSVLSGPADSKYGGIIATLETGATPGALRAQAAKADKRGGGAIKRLPGKPVSAKPRLAQPAQ